MMRDGVKGFFSALAFLTPLPVPTGWCGGESGLRGATPFFPVVGAIIGGVAAAATYGLDYVLSPLPASVLVVLLLVGASGGLHMDGLADTADGLLSARPRERILEIMRDSRIGTMGVVAVVGVLLLKVGLLSTSGGDARWRAVLVAPILGRSAVLLVMAWFPYVRTSGGLASVFLAGGPRARLWTVWPVLCMLVPAWFLLSWRGLVSAAAAIGVTLSLACYVKRRLGGYSGDTLGATSELIEVLPFLVAALGPS